MSEITRDGIERALVEFTGFKEDQAVIDAFMVIFDAYAVRQAERHAESSGGARDSYIHLLTQQAELLLDSAGRLAQAERLAEAVAGLSENVTFLSGLTDGMQMRNQQLADQVAALSVEIGDVKKAGRVMPDALDAGRYIDPDQPELPEPDPEVPDAGLDLSGLSDLEREILAAQEIVARCVPSAVEQILTGTVREEVLTVLPDKPKAKRRHVKGEGRHERRTQRPRQQPGMPYRGKDGTMLLRCRGDCGQAKPVAEFFRNAKSPSGYESKCRECRKAPKAA